MGWGTKNTQRKSWKTFYKFGGWKLDIRIQNAEQACLGACLLDKSAYIYAMENLVVDDFIEIKHKKLFKTMQHLLKNDMECDVVTIVSQFTGIELVEEIGGNVYNFFISIANELHLTEEILSDLFE